MSRICEPGEVGGGFLGRDGGPYALRVVDGLTRRRDWGRIVNVCVVGPGDGGCRRAAAWVWTWVSCGRRVGWRRSLTGLGRCESGVGISPRGWSQLAAPTLANLLTRGPSGPNLAWPPRTFSHGTHHLPCTSRRWTECGTTAGSPRCAELLADAAPDMGLAFTASQWPLAEVCASNNPPASAEAEP